MKIIDIQLDIHERFKNYCDGFKYKKSDFEYTKKLNGISHIFRIQLHSKTGWVKVAPSVFLGSYDVNKLFNNALSRNLPLTGITCGFGINNKYGDRGNYSIDSDKDIPSVVESLIIDFNEIAVPLFNKIQVLKDIDEFINKKSEEGIYRPESVSNACLGIATAKLCDNPDYNKICEDYYEFCKQSQSSELAEPILRIRKYLAETTALVEPV
jgi:hypothetical protein